MIGLSVSKLIRRGGPMWFLFQGLIVFAVSASNILYHWTPNSYLVGLAGMGLAWSLTWLISSLMARPAQN
jgi:hypothetical protein